MTDLVGRHWRCVLVAEREEHTLRLPIVVRVAEDQAGRPVDLKVSIDQPAAKLNTQLEEISLAISVGLRSGVPIGAYTHNMRGQTFWPNGKIEGDPHVVRCHSVVDYVAQSLERRYDCTRPPGAKAPPPAAAGEA